MQKINLAIWGILLFLVGCFFLLAFAADRESDMGVVYAFTSTTLLAAAFLTNWLGVKRNMSRGKFLILFIGLFFSIINVVLYAYSLMAGLSRVARYDYYWAVLLALLAIVAPIGVAMRVLGKDTLVSTRDRYLHNAKKRAR